MITEIDVLGEGGILHRMAHLKPFHVWRRGAALGLTAILAMTVVQPPAPSFAAGSTWSIIGQPGDDARFVDASDSSRQSNAFTISGNLQGEDRQPLARKRFAVSLDPSSAMLLATEGDDESTAEVLDLGATETDGAGKFTIRLPALRAVDDYLEEDGSVGLLFQSLDDDFELVWRTSVVLPRGSQQQVATAVTPDENVYSNLPRKPGETRPWRSPTQAHQTVVADGPQDGETTKEEGTLDLHAPVLSSPPAPVPVDALALTGVVNSSPTGSRQNAIARDASKKQKAKACNKALGNTPWSAYGWKKKGPVYREWVPVQRVMTQGKTNVKFEWGNTKQTSVDILVKLGYTNTHGGTAMTAGSSKAVKNGVGVDFTVGTWLTRDLEAEYDFATYTLRCKISGSDIWRDSKMTKVQQYQFKGFSRKEYVNYYTCPKARWKGGLDSPLWVSRETTSSFDFSLGANGTYAGVGADVSLTSKQVNTRTHKKTYTPVKDNAKICGQNGNPAVTEKVLEVS